MSTNTKYRRGLLSLRNRAMLDVYRRPFVATIARGTTSAGTPLVFSFSVPNQVSLIGTQVAFQSAIGPPGGGYDALTFPTFVVVTP